MRAQDYAAILFGRAPAGNRRARTIAAGHDARDAARGIFRRNALNLRVGSQKTAALIERNRMRLDGRNRVERRARTADEIVGDGNDDFADYVQVAVQ